MTLTALQVDGGSGVLRDYSRDLTDDLPFPALGSNPPVGAALYFGFITIPSASPVALWLRFGGPGNGAASRARIDAEAAAQLAACRPVVPGWPCGATTLAEPDDCDFTPKPVPPHQSAVVVWEAYADGTWTALTPVAMPARPAIGQVVDDTRSLTLDGLVEVNLPPSVTPTVLGAVTAPLTYLRVRLADGAYDAPVILAGVQPNAVAAVQRIPLWQQITIAGAVLPLPAPPAPGATVSLQFVATPDLTIKSLAVQSPPTAGQPGFALLNYAPPLAGNAGSVTLGFAFVGLGTAVPLQQVFIPDAPVENRCIRVFTHAGSTWTRWQQVTRFPVQPSDGPALLARSHDRVDHLRGWRARPGFPTVERDHRDRICNRRGRGESPGRGHQCALGDAGEHRFARRSHTGRSHHTRADHRQQAGSVWRACRSAADPARRRRGGGGGGARAHFRPCRRRPADHA